MPSYEGWHPQLERLPTLCPDQVIIDVASDRLWQEQTWRNDIAGRLELLHREDRYLACCRTGNRSGVAVTRMEKMGFKGIYHMDRGILAWQAAGLPIVAE